MWRVVRIACVGSPFCCNLPFPGPCSFSTFLRLPASCPPVRTEETCIPCCRLGGWKLNLIICREFIVTTVWLSYCARRQWRSWVVGCMRILLTIAEIRVLGFCGLVLGNKLFLFLLLLYHFDSTSLCVGWLIASNFAVVL